MRALMRVACVALLVAGVGGCVIVALVVPRGLVTFASGPSWNSDEKAIELEARLTLEYAARDVPLSIAVLDGTTTVANVTVTLHTVDTSVAETGTVQIPIDTMSYGNRDLTVWLDPDNIVTADPYRTTADVNAYKKAAVSVGG